MAWCFPVPAAWTTADQLDYSVFGDGYTGNGDGSFTSTPGNLPGAFVSLQNDKDRFTGYQWSQTEGPDGPCICVESADGNPLPAQIKWAAGGDSMVSDFSEIDKNDNPPAPGGKVSLTKEQAIADGLCTQEELDQGAATLDDCLAVLFGQLEGSNANNFMLAIACAMLEEDSKFGALLAACICAEMESVSVLSQLNLTKEDLAEVFQGVDIDGDGDIGSVDVEGAIVKEGGELGNP